MCFLCVRVFNTNPSPPNDFSIFSISFLRWRESWTMAPRSDLSLQEKSPAKAQSIRGKKNYSVYMLTYIYTSRMRHHCCLTKMLLLPLFQGSQAPIEPHLIILYALHIIIAPTLKNNKKCTNKDAIRVFKQKDDSSVSAASSQQSQMFPLPWIFNAGVHM